MLFLELPIINLQTKRIKTEMLFKLSYLNSNLALTLGYLNPALNNSALVFYYLLMAPVCICWWCVFIYVVHNAQLILFRLCTRLLFVLWRITFFFDNVLGIVHIYKYLWIVAALYKYYLFHISGLKSLLQSHCLLLSCCPYNADIDFHTEITHLCG